MDTLVGNSISQPRFNLTLLCIFGVIALMLSAAGIYGVMSYTVSQRNHEIGIRVALGATPRHIVRTILRGAMIPLAAGLAIGLAAALLLSRLLSRLLYGVSTNDSATYLAAIAFLLVIGAVASARPAWKAAAGDPLEAIRAE